MSDFDEQSFESELRKVKPDKLPEDLMARLMSAQTQTRTAARTCSTLNRASNWQSFFRWLIPVSAAAADASLILWSLRLMRGPRIETRVAGTSHAIKADDVEIDRQLIASFDAVARMPDGEPVRFRCREWMDEVVLRDMARGVVIERRTPRLEVVPVSFETY